MTTITTIAIPPFVWLRFQTFHVFSGRSGRFQEDQPIFNNFYSAIKISQFIFFIPRGKSKIEVHVFSGRSGRFQEIFRIYMEMLTFVQVDFRIYMVVFV